MLGIKLDKGTYVNRNAKDQPFAITMAVLQASEKKTDNVFVFVDIDDKEEVLLCLLRYPDIPQVRLDLRFEVHSRLKFHMKGSGAVHLTGNLLPKLPPPTTNGLPPSLSQEVHTSTPACLKRKLVDRQDSTSKKSKGLNGSILNGQQTTPQRLFGEGGSAEDDEEQFDTEFDYVIENSFRSARDQSSIRVADEKPAESVSVKEEPIIERATTVKSKPVANYDIEPTPPPEVIPTTVSFAFASGREVKVKRTSDNIAKKLFSQIEVQKTWTEDDVL